MALAKTKSTQPTAMFCGHGAMGVCVPTSWSDAQVSAFAQAGYPADPSKEWLIASALRVPCDCRQSFVHIQLREGRKMKTYRGTRSPAGSFVYVDGVPLRMRLDLYNHSPMGFEWGYTGSGPSQLALAILADHFGDDMRALELYQDFKFRVIAAIRTGDWKLTGVEIDAAVNAIIEARQQSSATK